MKRRQLVSQVLICLLIGLLLTSCRPSISVIGGIGYDSIGTPITFYWIVDPARLKIATIKPSLRLIFKGWTADHHYAIFNDTNHYDSNVTIIFDTQTWQSLVSPRSPLCELNPGYDCRDSSVAIAALSDRILTKGGRIIGLRDLKVTQVKGISPNPDCFVKVATWSPNEKYLVYIAPEVRADGLCGDDALYEADGDGTNPQFIQDVTLDIVHWDLPLDPHWSVDGQTFWFNSQYGFNPLTRQFQVVL